MNEWISVEDRLPEKDGRYLCRYGFGSIDYLITGCLSYIATDQEPHWQHASMGLIVTHWMPLPEPPEVQSHD